MLIDSKTTNDQFYTNKQNDINNKNIFIQEIFDYYMILNIKKEWSIIKNILVKPYEHKLNINFFFLLIYKEAQQF